MKNKNTLLFIFSLLIGSLHAQTQIGSDLDGQSANDVFGVSCAINANGLTMAGGASGYSGMVSNVGNVRVFDWNGSAWVLRGAGIVGEASGDGSGRSVALNYSGDMVAIGASNNDIANTTSSGHARIYAWDGFNWIQRGQDLDGNISSSFFGYSVDLNASGNRVIVGGLNNSTSYTFEGYARVYEWNGFTWVQMGQDINGKAPGDRSGSSVSMSASGSRVIIGGIYNDDLGINTGIARVYDWTGTSWVKVGQDLNGNGANAQFGFDCIVSGDGNTISVSAPRDSIRGYLGYVENYSIVGNTWTLVGQRIDGFGGNFGNAIDINYSGTKLLVGASGEGTVNAGSGVSRVYELINGFWIKLGQNINGESAGDESGFSAGLDSAGNNIAIGAHKNSGVAQFAGHVRVFDIRNLVSVQENFTQIKTELFPNPFQESLQLNTSIQSTGELKIYNIKGQVVYQKRFSNSNSLTFNPIIPKGFYIVNLEFQNGEQEVFKVVKN